MTQPITRGYAKTKEQEAVLKAHGIPARAIFLEGRGAETLETCLATFRGRPGLLILAHDLRTMAITRKGLAAIMSRLEAAGIKVKDITHPEDSTQAALIHRANVSISAARFYGDRPRARKLGRQGGLAKGDRAERNRCALAPRWLIDRIVDHPRLTWRDRRDLLAPYISEATMRRHYGAAPTRAKK